MSDSVACGSEYSVEGLRVQMSDSSVKGTGMRFKGSKIKGLGAQDLFTLVCRAQLVGKSEE
jgi:hypothetical protein